MRYDKVEYSKYAGLYYALHDFEVPLCTPEFSSSKIIKNHFHIKNDKGGSGIGYDRITGHELMVQLGLMANFKRQVPNGMAQHYP